MATIRDSASDKPLRINHEGSTHELIITVRGGLDEPDKLTKLVGKTVSTWMKAYTAITNETYTMPEGSQSACEQVGVEPHPVEPHCTVWNKTWNGASLTVHSNSNGQNAVDAYGALVHMTATLRENAPFLFENVQSDSSASQQNNVAPAVQGTLNAFIRTTRAGMADGLLSIETGKTDSPAWTSQAKLATENYDAKTEQFQPKTIVLYPLATGNNVNVKSYDGTLFISVTTGAFGDIAIWQRENTVYQGKEIPSDWNSLLGKLGLDSVAEGQVFALPADYIAMKAGKVTDGKQYKNFYGFFTAPEQSQDSAGKQELDEHFGKQYEPSTADVGDGDNIPF